MPHRPQTSLDGRWQLELVDVPGHAPGTVTEVAVPGSWTLQVPGCGLAVGTVRYERAFRVPVGWPLDGCLVLRFGAVNHVAEVLLNGRCVARHEGGWTAFEVPVDAALLTGGEERLEVVVSYPPLLPRQRGAASLQETPHGKQTWYGTNAGIWQPVVLEHRPRRHLADALVRTDAATGRVTARATLAEPTAAGTQVALVVRGGDGEQVLEAVEHPVPGATQVDLAATVAAPALWSPEDPALYVAQVELREDGRVVDAVAVTTGFRTVETKDGRVVLNGVPVELRGVLDQDYHPGSELRARSVEELEELFRGAKRLGFNLLRCHVKHPDPAYFATADRVGLLVWAELPSWQRHTPTAAAAAEALLSEMVVQDGHHPSVVAWSVVNESWGVDLRDPDQRAWLARTQRLAKELAPGTLVVDNSACESNFHVRSDLDDFHVYRGIPERRAAWDAWVEDFASRPAWTYSPYGDAERTGEEPLVVSEFGNWGLPDVTEGIEDADAWWAEAGRDWAFGAAHAAGVRERFLESGLDEVFGSWPAFLAATQHQQLVATRYQIGSLRRRREIGGYVLTQLSDVQWEANGLFDMARRPRAFAAELALANGPYGVVLRPAAYSGHVGEALAVAVDVVPPGDGGAATARWEVVVEVDGDEVRRVRVEPERTTWTDDVALPAGPGTARVAAALLVDGRVVARDVADVVVLAPVLPRARPVQVDDDALADWLPRLAVPLVDRAPQEGLLVTRCFGPRAQAHARAGGRVLVLAEDRDALGGAFAAPLLARLSPREGDGDWVPRFDWLRRSGPLAALPGGPLLDLAFEHVIGAWVIDFLPAPLRPARLHSAVFAGWLQHRASTTVTVPWSRGAVTITTFRVREAGVDDPAAVALARALLDVAEDA